MIDQSVDPAVHNISLRIARRCLDIVMPLLSYEDREEALSRFRAFYVACRVELDKPNKEEPEV